MLPKKIKTKALPRDNEHWTDSKVAYHSMNPTAQSYVPHFTAAPVSPAPITENFVHYLACRDLVSTNLFHFDDRPGNYRAWQSSFKNVVGDLGLTASEEFDLLTKWLGKESTEHVKMISSVHVGNPAAALRKAWGWLQECYASPQVIESTLFKKLEDFPRIYAKDHTKLRDLEDLLMEIQCAKKEGYLPGLT